MTSICNSVTAEERYQLLTMQTSAHKHTVLHIAAFTGHTVLITCILDTVEPAHLIQLLDITDSDNRTALDLALQYDEQSAADLIKQYRAAADNQRDVATEGKNYYSVENWQCQRF